MDVFREHGLGSELEDKTACDWESGPWDHLLHVVDHRTLSGSKGRRHSIDKGKGQSGVAHLSTLSHTWVLPKLLLKSGMFSTLLVYMSNCRGFFY